MAADWTSLATIAQLARGWGCWGREVSGWSAPLHKCAKAGGRVATNVLIRDLDLGEFNAFDNRRVEVIADGLTLRQGPQLATDTTLVSPLRGGGCARSRAADHNGAALEGAGRKPLAQNSPGAQKVDPVWSPTPQISLDLRHQTNPGRLAPFDALRQERPPAAPPNVGHPIR